MITSSFAMAQVRAEGSKAHNPRRAQNDFGINCHEGCLFLHYATNHKPGMNKERSEQPVMGAHHLETLTKGSTMVLHRHTSIEIMGDNGAYIAQWQVKPCRLFHHTYAPVYIGRETIIEIIMDAFCQVGTGIE